MLLYAIDSQRLAEPGVRRVIFDPVDVQDVLQNVLVAVAEQVGSFRNEGRFTSWLFTVSQNQARSFLRRKRDTSDLPDDLADPERISSMVATELSVQKLLQSLPENYRAAVTMRDLQGMAYTGIAVKLDLNLDTARSRIARGRALLAAACLDMVE